MSGSGDYKSVVIWAFKLVGLRTFGWELLESFPSRAKSAELIDVGLGIF